MIFNNESFDVLVEANYEYFIEISANPGDTKFIVAFAPGYKDLKNLKLNERTLVTDDFHWDPSIVRGENYYVIDISDINIYLTRLDENLFKLELGVKEPSVIYSTIEEKLEYFGINVEFSFNYDYKPTPNYDILKRGNKIHTHEELNSILEKL